MVTRNDAKTGNPLMTPDPVPLDQPNADLLGDDLHMLVDASGSSTSEPIAAFVVDDEKRANWVVRKVIEARAYGHRVKRWAEHEQHRAVVEEERLVFLFGKQLEAWAATEIAKFNGRRKCLHLPSGQIGFRCKLKKLVVVDEQAVIAWARHECPQAIQRIEKLIKSAINQYFLDTGELPSEGVALEAERNVFYIK
jgi:hypothetical protein